MGIQENIYKALADSICSGNTLDYKRDKADGLWLRYDKLVLHFCKGYIDFKFFLGTNEIFNHRHVLAYTKGDVITFEKLDGYIPIKIENRP